MKFITATLSAMKKKLSHLVVAAFLMLSPAFAFCLPDPGSGGNPDSVPFDDNLNLIFLTLAVLFAGFVMVKKFRKTATKA